MQRRVIRLPNGETELVVRRYKIPGKHMGYLSIVASGNCYWTFRHVARFVFDLAHHPDANLGGRAGVMKLFEARRKEMNDEAFCQAIGDRMLQLRKNRQ